MRRMAPLGALLLVLLASTPSWGRGGGGCVAKDTPILTPSGPIPIQHLRWGDPVWSLARGRLETATVHALAAVTADGLLEVSTGEATLRVTAEHPVMVAPGEWRQADRLRVGDTVYVAPRGELRAAVVREVREVASEGPAFNLLVHPHGTFISADFVVHNKGCFLPESPVLRGDGTETRISAVQEGEELLAFTTEGRMVRAKVRAVIQVEAEQYVILRTDRTTVRVTPDHPFYVGNGTFKTVEILREGDAILAWDGQSFAEQRIASLERVRERVPVFNLQTDRPNTFFAGGLAVHNKGGGGGGSSRSSSRSSSSRGRSGTSSGDDTGGLIAFLIFLVVFAIVFGAAIKANKRRKSENLDFLYGPGQVARKAGKTEKLLAFLGQQDPTASPDGLRNLAEKTFRKLQACWQERGYDPMRPLMMPALFDQHWAQLKGMVRNHEINRLEDLKVERIDLVNVRYTEKLDQREFTALISASVRDYYVDDRSGTFLRGDSAPAKFQEFWTFQRSGDRWLLREIEQAGESDVLKDENFVEMLTDDALRGIYGETAKEGVAGPWLEKEEETKATRIERMLNFLGQTDRLWKRQQMLEGARQVFMGVYLARESGDPSQVPSADLFPEVAESLKGQIRQWQMDGVKVEYRNLCVRKADLILVRNFSDNTRDEFTVRIDAHAQKVVRKGERTLNEQKYVTPFEEYWTFGRLDGQWKLKEVLPPGRAKRAVAEENVDEDSSAGQLDWYYRQTRAN